MLLGIPWGFCREAVEQKWNREGERKEKELAVKEGSEKGKEERDRKMRKAGKGEGWLAAGLWPAPCESRSPPMLSRLAVAGGLNP